jgi:serine/threonine-protein kinase
MSDNQKQRVNSLFKKVMTMATVDAYQFLNKSNEDQEVIDKVAEILSDSETRTQFLAENPDVEDIIQPATNSVDLIGKTIGDIQFLKLLGKGGMGEVYLGVDTRLDRKVAIKTIRGKHRLSTVIKERFRREALILSKMDHANICRIYNIIETKDADFLILEYVEGKTLKQTDSSNLSNSQKIQIAESLIKALIVAHEKSIVHRDIKPDNIMLTNKGEAKILDFGISRSLTESQQPIEQNTNETKTNDRILSSSYTSPGSIIGTLGYMCPEQAKGEDITPASDIYSLGVVFQELFSNQSAHPKNPTQEMLFQRAKFGTTEDIRNVTRDIAYLINRMKSATIETRPTAVDALAILTRIKQKPKRRLRYLFATLLIIVSFLGFLKYTIDLKEQSRQANIAREQSEQVTEFLASLFWESDPYQSKGETLTARQMLDRGAERIDKELSNQPHSLSQLKLIIGIVYKQLALYSESDKQLQKALKVYETSKLNNPQQYLRLIQALASLEFVQGNYDKTNILLLKAIDYANKNDLNDHPFVYSMKYELAVSYSKQAKYVKAEQQLLNLQIHYQKQQPRNLKNIVEINNSLGLLYWNQSNPEKGLKYMQTALKLIDKDEENNELKATLLSNIANLLGNLGRYEEASEKALESVQMREQILPDDHPDLALSYDNLAVAYYRANRMEECIMWNGKALDIYEKTLGRNNKDFAMTLANRAVLLRNSGQLDKAEAALNEVLNTLIQTLDEKHPYVADYSGDLAKIYNLQGREQEAIKQFQKSIDLNIEIKRAMPSHSRFYKAWREQALLQKSTGDKQAAKASFEMMLENLKSQEKVEQEIVDEIEKEFTELK